MKNLIIGLILLGGCARQPLPITTQERLALEGLQGQGMLISNAIASVSSDVRTQKAIAQIAMAYGKLAVDEAELLRLASERAGVAVVVSGNVWAPK